MGDGVAWSDRAPPPDTAPDRVARCRRATQYMKKINTFLVQKVEGPRL